MFTFVPPFLKDSRLFVFCLGFFFIIIPTVLYFLFNKYSQLPPLPQVSQPASSPSASFDDLTDIRKTTDFNVLILGYGGAGHDGGFLTDIVMLVHFNILHAKIAFITIPRDLWVTLPDGRNAKVNAAFVQKDAPQYPRENVSLEEALEGAVRA